MNTNYIYWNEKKKKTLIKKNERTSSFHWNQENKKNNIYTKYKMFRYNIYEKNI